MRSRNAFRAARVSHVLGFASFLLAILLLLPLPAAAQSSATPGTLPASSSPRVSAAASANALAPLITETGHISWSLDGVGSNTVAGHTIRIQKPAGATLRRAFLAAASTGETGRMLVNGDVRLDGTALTWERIIPSSITSSNAWTEVTSLVKTRVDAAPAGVVDFHVDEVATAGIDGEGLFAIFDDPAQTSTNTIVLLFGAQSTTGDTFFVRFADPIDTSNSAFGLDLSLGISFGFQPPNFHVQFSRVDVNGQRLTSCAGGQDDGQDFNGALITVGGIGDLTTNPAPLCTVGADGPRSDDELYDMRPFVRAGDTTLNFATVNPSNNDNIFFAGFFVRGATAVVGEGIVLAPDGTTAPTGTPHALTATVQDSLGQPVIGRTVTFQVTSGPNSGLSLGAVTNSSGIATVTYTSSGVGTDTITASFVDSTGSTRTSNEVTHVWTGGPVATNRSLAVSGSGGYADATHAADLNLTSNWSFELWFKDEHPNGFNHDYVTLFDKGDRNSNAAVPYFVTLGHKQLLVGVRNGWTDSAVQYDLFRNRVDPTRWHHLAATFQGSTRTLILFLDGVQVASGRLAFTSAGNADPVNIGRNGPASGKYFRGKVDDVRLWSTVRSSSEIASNYLNELTSAPTGLVANWKFNDPDGPTAADSANAHTATLHPGAAFSNDVHP